MWPQQRQKLERLRRTPAGEIVLQLKTPYRDGTTHLVMTPLEFLQRVAALVPRPRLHLIRFHGGLAPNAALRAQIVPREVEPAPTTAIEEPAVIIKILSHLGLPTRAPPKAPARLDAFFQTA